MTPGGRLAAAIEILDEVIAAARDEGPAADTLIARYFRDRRYAGSKDRRAVRDLVYDVIRWAGQRPDSGRQAMIDFAGNERPDLLTLFGADGHAPAAIETSQSSVSGEPVEPRDRSDGRAATFFDKLGTNGGVQGWLAAQFERRFGPDAPAELAALMARAPLDLRVNRLKADRAAVAAMLPPTVPTEAPDGLRATEPFPVEAHPAFLEGLVEVQDTGSQLACAACEVAPGMTVVDFCAGAGGKTLALAAAMANEGRLIACDTDRARLGRMTPRAERAGATIIEPRLLDAPREGEAVADLVGTADVVLVDAPCSGTGTWRRNPEARWRLTPDRLARLTGLQAHILDTAQALVTPGGRLVYVVCSLLPAEGGDQVDAFLARCGGWRRERDDRVLTPHRDGTDGFFIAVLTPIC